MAKYLIAVSEIYRVDTEAEVENIVSNAKNDRSYTLNKYKCEHKERKQKGEMVDQWFRVQLDKVFNDEKDPERYLNIIYEEA